MTTSSRPTRRQGQAATRAREVSAGASITVPTVADFFRSCAAEDFDRVVIVNGDTALWLPAGVEPLDLIIHVDATRSMGIVDQCLSAIPIPGTDGRNGAESGREGRDIPDWLRANLATLRGGSATPLADDDLIRGRAERILRLYDELDRLHSERGWRGGPELRGDVAKPEPEPEPEPKSESESNAQSGSLGGATKALWRSNQPESVKRMRELEREWETLVPNRWTSEGLRDAEARHLPLPPSARATAPLLSPVDRKEARLKRAIRPPSRQPIPEPQDCPAWVRFSILANAIADILNAGKREKSPAALFVNATSRLAGNPDELPDAIARLRKQIASAKPGSLEAVMLSELRVALSTVDADVRRSVSFMDARLPKYRDGEWSVAFRRHAVFAGNAADFAADEPTNQRIISLVRAMEPDATPSQIAAHVSIGAITARALSERFTPVSTHFYLIDTAEHLAIKRGEDAEKKARADSAAARKAWTQNTRRKPAPEK